MASFIIDESKPIIVEFEPRPGMKQVGISPIDMADRSIKALDSAMNAIYYMAKRVNSAVDAIDKKPDGVEVEFGLKLDAETGAIIAKAGIEATLNVKLIWGKQ